MCRRCFNQLVISHGFKTDGILVDHRHFQQNTVSQNALDDVESEQEASIKVEDQEEEPPIVVKEGPPAEFVLILPRLVHEEDRTKPKNEEDRKRKSRTKTPIEGNQAARNLNNLVLVKFLQNEEFDSMSPMAASERISESEWSKAREKFKTSVFDLSRDEILRLVSHEVPAMNAPFPLAWQGDCIISPREKNDRRIAFKDKKYNILELFYVGLKSEKDMAHRSIDSVITTTCGNKSNCVKSDHLQIKTKNLKKGQKRGGDGLEYNVAKKLKTLLIKDANEKVNTEEIQREVEDDHTRYEC